MTDSSFIPVKTVRDLDQSAFHIVDVRTPAEYQEFHIPGAINLPIFSNKERATVGTTYKQIGKEDAKQLGIEIVSPRLPEYYKKLKQLQESVDKPVLIYCARGGMRSKSIASVLLMMGLKTYQLEGGIRNFRYNIMNSLNAIDYSNKKFIVIEGHTGTKKTVILNQLQSEGYPVLDLEGLAGHRGSMFGQVGIHEKSQKQFELDLFTRLQQLENSSYLIIESESRRLGKIILPEWVMVGKERGTRIHITSPIEERVAHIIDTYQPSKYRGSLYEALCKLQKRLVPSVKDEVFSSFEQGNYNRVVELLLIHYYDPKYNYAANKYDTEPVDVRVKDLQDVIEQVKLQINTLAMTSSVFHQ
jgi:tRNA 2-selenouridine synthase